MSGYNVAILGATGIVGETMLSILEERQFPVHNLYLLASERSAGTELEFNGEKIVVEDVTKFDFAKADIGLFSAGGKVSEKYAPLAASKGCIVIDNTSHFRLDKDVPLIVPEVNLQALADYKKKNIIANPNCSTIQMLVAIKPIYDEVGIERINVATYQAVSGTGAAAVDELGEQTLALFNAKQLEPEVYPKGIAFNVLPQIDVLQPNGYTKEEMKMVLETQKILGDPNIKVNPTAVRVPVFYGHSEAVHIETKRKISADYARTLLAKSPGIIVMDEMKDGVYPTPLEDAAGDDAVYVGRIREDISCDKGLNMWVVADNVRKGAALNSVQIAEALVSRYLSK